MPEVKNQPSPSQEVKTSKVALAIRFGKATPGESGLYLPLQAAMLEQGQGAIFGDGFVWAEKVPLENNQFQEKANFYRETGELDAEAKLEEDLEISLRNGKKAEITLGKGSMSYRYIYDEESDTAMYGVVGSSKEVIIRAAKNWQQSNTRS